MSGSAKEMKRRPFYHCRLRTKIYIAYLLFLLLLSGLLNGIVYAAYTMNMKETSLLYTQEIISQLSENMDDTIDTFEETVSYKMVSNGVFDYQQDWTQISEYSVIRKLKEYTAAVNGSNDIVQEVYILDGKQNSFYFHKNKEWSQTDFENTMAYEYVKEQYEDIVTSWGAARWVTFTDRPGTVYMIKAMLSKSTATTLMNFYSIACVGINEEYLRSMYKALNASIQGMIGIYNEELALLSCSPELLTTAAAYGRSMEQGTLKNNGEFGRFIVSVVEGEKTRWSIVCFSPKDHVYQGAKKLFGRLIQVELLLCVVTSFIAAAIAKGLTVNIGKLLEGVRMMREGNLRYQIVPSGGDETGMLCEEFNKMGRDMVRLIDDMASSKADKERAEYNALTAQMNPHFLFNTLESINGLAKIHGEVAIVDSISHLSRLLRASISGHENEILFEKELEYIQSYLKLQNDILGGRIEVDYEIDPETLQCLVPKLILQPIVENSIIHGVEDMVDGAFIFVSARMQKENVVIEISDNGKGIPPDRIDTILNEDQASAADRSRTHIGLRSVNQRIRLLYGKEYGITLESDCGMGTVVRAWLPYHEIKFSDRPT